MNIFFHELLQGLVYNSKMILKERFQIMKGDQNSHINIGFGSYGQVKLARDLVNDSIVAVKMISKIAKEQIEMHIKLDHPNIIKLIDVHIDKDRQITNMILEYADGGTLFQKIRMKQVSKKEIRKYFKDVCLAIEYLHKQNIMHRDIKPENVLLTKNGEAKLCDFGFATFQEHKKTLCGTYQYMSPQMIQNKIYDNKIDIWALGILLFESIAGHAPFRGHKPEEVVEQMKTRIYFNQNFQPEDIDLIKMILRVTPQKRPTIMEILKQPFFKIQDNLDDKDFTSLSTINTEESFIKIASMPHLGEGSLIKKNSNTPIVFRKNYQKKAYSPFYYIPKIKIGSQVPITPKKLPLAGASSFHQMKNKNISETIPIPIIQYKNTTRIGTSGNRCFSRPLFLNKTQMSQSYLKSEHLQVQNKFSPINYLSMNKSIKGFGRYS